MSSIAAVVCWAPAANGQEKDKPDSIQSAEQQTATGILLKNLTQQIERNENRLRALRAGVAESGAEALDLILPQPRVLGAPRGARDTPASPATFRVSFPLESNEARRIQDPNNTDGLILTGTKLTDYAKLLLLEPEYELTLASYRQQTQLHEQLVSVYADALQVKDKKVAVLLELVTAHEQRAKLYKTMADIQRESWLDRFFHKIAFPAGITIGVFVGSMVARN
jgi:hypothetical protein